MLFHIVIFFISLTKCKYILYIDDMFIEKDKNQENNYSIIFNIKRLNISEKIIINNLFKVVLQSDNPKEQNKNITFDCSLFINSSINDEIKCTLKDLNYSNLIGPFYFRLEHFKKSMIIQFHAKFLNITLEMLDEIFYIGIIRNFRTKKNLFNIELNYRISDVIIPIAFGINNKFTYPLIVAITSILENANANTKYDFYILHTFDFHNENKKKLKSIEKKYNKKCSIIFFNMKNNFLFQKANLSRHIKTFASYFRLCLSYLLPNIDKIIYLDGDTLTFDDLKNLYDINMDDY